MKKTLLSLILLAGSMIVFASQSYAVPTIDGTFTGGEGWESFILFGSDINEAGIPDSYDIKEIRFVQELGGAPADDGLYILLQTYAAPSLVDLAPLPPVASILVGMDFNGDADFTDAVDRFTLHTLATGFDVFDGTGAMVLSGVLGTHYAMGAVIEYFIPASTFSLGTFPLSASSLVFGNYDNGGTEPDDRTPDTGFLTPVPEPGTLFLLGSGLLGMLGFRRFRFAN